MLWIPCVAFAYNCKCERLVSPCAGEMSYKLTSKYNEHLLQFAVVQYLCDNCIKFHFNMPLNGIRMNFEAP